ncbi:hypothetical protein [Acidithiobacillus sp.]
MASPKPYSISIRSILDKMGTLQMPVATAADCEKLARLEGLSLENPAVINGILYYLGSLAVTARFEGVTVDSVAEHWFDGWRNDSAECHRWYRPEMIYAARLAWKAFSYPVDTEDGPSIPVAGNPLAGSPWAQAVAGFSRG